MFRKDLFILIHVNVFWFWAEPKNYQDNHSCGLPWPTVRGWSGGQGSEEGMRETHEGEEKMLTAAQKL